MTAAPPNKPEPHQSPVVAALEIRIYSAGRGYTKAEVHWHYGLRASLMAQRHLIASSFSPTSMTELAEGLDILRALLSTIEKSV